MKYIAHHALNDVGLNNTIRGIRIASKKMDIVEIDLVYNAKHNDIYISHDFPLKLNQQADLLVDLAEETAFKLMLDIKCEGLSDKMVKRYFNLLSKIIFSMSQHTFLLASFDIRMVKH